MIRFLEKNKHKLPCKFNEIFEDERDQEKIYESFVYLLHLLQLGKIEYKINKDLLYIKKSEKNEWNFDINAFIK